jgi:hypothetical protein
MNSLTLSLLQPARWLGLSLVLMSNLAQALTVEFQRVADGVYAHVGDTGARSADNEGLNANIGLVVTPAGAVLIDSGATAQSARQIRDAAAKRQRAADPLGDQHRRPGPPLAGQWLLLWPRAQS